MPGVRNVKWPKCVQLRQLTTTKRRDPEPKFATFDTLRIHQVTPSPQLHQLPLCPPYHLAKPYLTYELHRECTNDSRCRAGALQSLPSLLLYKGSASVPSACSRRARAKGRISRRVGARTTCSPLSVDVLPDRTRGHRRGALCPKLVAHRYRDIQLDAVGILVKNRAAALPCGAGRTARDAREPQHHGRVPARGGLGCRSLPREGTRPRPPRLPRSAGFPYRGPSPVRSGRGAHTTSAG
jgi:hypothetical protein